METALQQGPVEPRASALSLLPVSLEDLTPSLGRQQGSGTRLLFFPLLGDMKLNLDCHCDWI